MLKKWDQLCLFNSLHFYGMIVIWKQKMSLKKIKVVPSINYLLRLWEPCKFETIFAEI